MKKVKVKIKGKDLKARSFAGNFWTEGFRRKGCEEVVIDVEGDEELIMLDWGMPYTRYGDKELEKKWREYIKEREKKEGWIWCASWDYGMFKKLKN